MNKADTIFVAPTSCLLFRSIRTNIPECCVYTQLTCGEVYCIYIHMYVYICIFGVLQTTTHRQFVSKV